jgi:hypothetical protein
MNHKDISARDFSSVGMSNSESISSSVTRMNTPFNKGVSSFGLDTVLENIAAFVQVSYPARQENINAVDGEPISGGAGRKPLVSVGSGNAHLEKRIQDQYGVEIICVDPDPTAFNHAAFDIAIPPHFPLVSDLIANRPELVGDCTLLLNWCPPNTSEFDYDAILALKPLGFLAIFESFHGNNGAAGGHSFFEFVRGRDALSSQYQLVHATRASKEDKCGLLIEWHQRSDLPTPVHELETEVKLVKPLHASVEAQLYDELIGAMGACLEAALELQSKK